MDLNATIFGQLISFILFVWFCMKYIWPKIITIIEKREKELHSALLIIEKSKKKNRLSKKKAQDILNNSKKKAFSIIQQANETKLIILEKAKILAENEKKRIILEAYSEINIEKEKAKNKIMKSISKIAISIAKKVIIGSVKNEINYKKIPNL